MPYTPFVDEKDLSFFEQKGITITDDIDKAHILLASNLQSLKPLRFAYGSNKKYLVWTNEPRFDTTFKKFDRQYCWRLGIDSPSSYLKTGAWRSDVHIMNVYTGDVFIRNYTLPFIDPVFRTYWQEKLDYLDADNFPAFKHKKIVALMYYRNDQKKWSLKWQGRELDLCYLRTQIALEGHKLNKMDIYGKNWPNGIALENSRGSNNWQDCKADILKNYHFNLCFENTNFDYYCSEKIWDSVQQGCLPIYYGEGNKIYEDFPKNSFLDYCEFKTPSALFDYIDRMDVEEFRTRMNRCIDAFNTVHEKLKNFDHYEEMLFAIITKIKDMVGR